ncbi:MAG: DUF3011 domain-containing protein [Arenimonas sp.]|uniref:DUF3011 domain-containing protein n=1 Tax=Arenimonas sp. TaxID=1872635 RepID=UPI0025B989A0|nr:DUF3011 domain-containing protein [Arenimonas sp.]MBW8366621.1 DUF3011 domain-containing protein [Arenimonas sp.]
MYRLLLAASLAIGLVATAPVAQAQPKAQSGTRSYAPEDLRQLAPRDRIRVLETEYEEQSNGRRLPSDQRDFYLAQINSGWTFSRIKTDIAQSLRGNSGGWNGGNNGGNNGYPGNSGGGRAVLCESIKERYRECVTNFRSRAELSRTLSRDTCRENYSWGQRRGTVWVSRGCRAEFVESRSGWGPGRPENNYNVTCSSEDNRYRTCAWQSRFGRPYLIENLSDTQCVQGRNWGYTNSNSIWVDRGCRGRFAPRN